MRFVIVTGTSTGIGKTIATAALTSLAQQRDLAVAVVKPAQTGAIGNEPADIATIARLSGCPRVAELVTLRDPLAPDTAARLRDLVIPDVKALARQSADVGVGADLVVLEGSGGVLVRLDTAGGTLIDLASQLNADGHDVTFVVVTSVALGTLNHTELTVRALLDTGHQVGGIVIGSLPAAAGLAERLNLDEIPRVTGFPVLGAIPERSGRLTADDFQAQCAGWLPRADLVIDAVR
jgi:dethiobiotin synthetase